MLGSLKEIKDSVNKSNEYLRKGAAVSSTGGSTLMGKSDFEPTIHTSSAVDAIEQSPRLKRNSATLYVENHELMPPPDSKADTESFIENQLQKGGAVNDQRGAFKKAKVLQAARQKALLRTQDSEEVKASKTSNIWRLLDAAQLGEAAHMSDRGINFTPTKGQLATINEELPKPRKKRRSSVPPTAR